MRKLFETIEDPDAAGVGDEGDDLSNQAINDDSDSSNE